MKIAIIRNRFNFINELIKILGDQSSCYGEFLRIYFENEFHDEFNDTNMLNFYFINKKQGFFAEENINEFSNLLHFFQINNKIGEYKIISVICTGDSRQYGYEEKIPFYRLVLQREYDFIVVNILCWKPKFLGEISINCIEYNNKGFYSGENKFDLKEIKENIKNKEIYFSKDLEVIQKLAFPDKSIPRNRKIKFLSLIYNNILRKLSFIPLGYKLRGKLPFITTENIEECPITSQEAPYINLKLECSHKISIYAYRGILFSKNQNTEAIRCPYCRSNLKIKFLNL
jgi:DNA-directed RNA polymerase subunit RPC12/RpoP